jgi:capsule polysaccharide export protein KpsE/RkpR
MSSSEIHKPLAASTLRETRKRQARAFSLRAFVVVGLPTLLVAAYLGIVASRQYESFSLLAVDAANSASLLGPIPGSAVPRDTMMAQECLKSREAFAELVSHHGYRDHFQKSSVDRMSRLSPGASDEKAYRYFTQHTETAYDPSTSFLSLRVRAFGGGAAHRYANALVGFCDERMRSISVGARRSRVANAEAEVAAARQRLADEQATIRASAGDPDQLEFATKAKDLALASWVTAQERLEAARGEALRDDRYIVRVMAPSAPDAWSHPEIFRTVFAVFLVTSALFVIGTILISAAREHADV